MCHFSGNGPDLPGSYGRTRGGDWPSLPVSGRNVGVLVRRWDIGYPKPNELLTTSCVTPKWSLEVSLSLFQDKLNLKEFDDPMNMEGDRVLKPYSAPSDFIDKLVVNFENFLEEVSTEELGKGQENILKEEKNEYVTSPYWPYHHPISTEIPQRKPQHSGIPEGTSSETKEQLSSVQSLGSEHLREEGEPNPYLKNSVMTREFVTSEKPQDEA